MRESGTEEDERPVVVIEFGNEVPLRSFDRILPDTLRERRIRIDPLHFPGLADGVPTVAEQARHWASVLDGTRPRAVLAYCSAARLAARLTHALPDPSVPLVLFDPVVPEPTAAQQLLHELAAGMDAGLQASEVPRLAGLAPDAALTQASRFLRSLLTRCAPDLDEELADDLTTGQRAWLSYTLSVAADGPAPALRAHVVLSSAAHWESNDALSVQRTPLSAVQLFQSPAVKASLRDLLASGSVTATEQERQPAVLPPFVERDAAEAMVAAQWSRILGTPPAGLDDDFFASCGNSLRAAQLIAALRAACAVDIPLDTIFRFPAFRALSAYIRGDALTGGGRFVTLNASGAGAPLLLVPAASGDVVGLHRFGGAPVDRPVHGLRTRGLDVADGPPCTTLAEMIGDYADVLEASAAPRSLHLAGYCVGGVLAYELARELRSRGWDIRSVLLLNTSLYCPPRTVGDGAQEKLRSIASEAGRELPPGDRDPRSVFQDLVNGGADLMESAFAAFRARLEVYGSVAAAVSGYVPEPADFPVRLFSTDDRDDPSDVALTPHPVTDWPDLGLADFQLHAVSVDHFEMINHEPTLRAVEAVMKGIDALRDVPSAVAHGLPPTSPSGETRYV
ncbi:thioesterase domain-containing protein [Streptomyces chromofuscus]|uniref:thioesterase domain-containing protein n=1 Tax=Streptomyces chromofuscus TaxID=42881 RepID=UPI00167700CB|nr:thioesterase domain-containing protein [Streptomyces chromofuscus]